MTPGIGTHQGMSPNTGSTGGDVSTTTEFSTIGALGLAAVFSTECTVDVSMPEVARGNSNDRPAGDDGGASTKN